jgi:hypothetical protein
MPFSCDTHLFAFRTLSEPTIYTSNGKRSTRPRKEASLIVERNGIECQIDGEAQGCEKQSGQVTIFRQGAVKLAKKRGKVSIRKKWVFFDHSFFSRFFAKFAVLCF